MRSETPAVGEGVAAGDVAGLDGTTLLMFTDDDPHGIVATYGPVNKRRGILTYSSTGSMAQPAMVDTFGPTTTLAKLSKELTGSARATVVAVPPVQWTQQRPHPARPWFAVIAAIIAMLAILLLPAPFGVLTAAASGLAGTIAWFAAKQRTDTQLLTPGDLRLEGDDIVSHARARLAGRSQAHRDRRADAAARVDEVKEDLGELQTDIVYRIDFPALFDTAVATTEAMHTALMAFDDATDRTPVDEVERLAAAVEVAYSVARDHAETVGHLHLPDAARADARRAAKAARLAESAATEGERTASLTQVARILDSLALYYLPRLDAETLAIEAPPSPR